MKITSQPLTFLDTTDSRKLEVYISSNHPTIQLYDVNDKEYTPDWSTTNLHLSAQVYLDSKDITTEQLTIQWYSKINNTETLMTNNTSLTINTNMPDTAPIITYICKVSYQNINAVSQITFTRTDTGLNGVNGKDGASAPAIQAQYSIDGKINWTPELDTATHKYIRYSYDGGVNWTTAIKMVGEDGTSVNIKGTATGKNLVTNTSYYTLVYDSTTISGATLGDAYLLDGRLYVCVDSRDGNDYFMDVGQIQGPKGNDGVSEYVYIRYASSASPADTDIMLAPNNTTTHIGICVSAATSAPLIASSYMWSKFVGDNAKSIILSGTSQIFKVAQGDVPTYSPTVIMVTAQAINTTVALWEYSLDGGIIWTSNIPEGVTLSVNDNRLTITGSKLTSNSLVIRASNGIYKDTYTVYKVFDGIDGVTGDKGDPAPIAFLTNENVSFAANPNGIINDTLTLQVVTSVAAYIGTTKQMPTLGAIADADIPPGMKITITDDTVLQEKQLTLSFEKDTTLGSSLSNSGTITIPVTEPVVTNLKLSWSKINTGPIGVGIASTQIKYGISESATVQPTEWSDNLPVADAGEYLWTRTVIDYTDPDKEDTVTYTYSKQGETGTAGSSVTVSSIQYQEGISATTPPTGKWSDTVIGVVDGRYLWTKTEFSDGQIAYGVAKQGQKGDKGDQGIQGIQGPKGEQGIQGPKGADGQTSYFHIKYSANANGNPMSETPSTYIGTYVDYTASDSDDYAKYTWSRFVGSQGAKGDQGIAGTNGTDGKTSYLHIAYATSANGSSGFSVSDSANKTYIGQYTDYTEADSADYTKYKWTLIKGDKGDKGDQGVQGPKGDDGQQFYTWIKYADTPTSGMSNSPDGKTYIGLAYNKTTATESNTYSDYMWSLIKGETGPTGPKGDDGQQYYTWIKYADNASGANMSDSPTGKLYIGLAYNKTTSTESNTASDYTWALFKGDKGETGAIGAPGADAVTFQVYSSNGYAISINTPTVTLQTFAYIGDVAITAGATYQWYVYNDSGWTAISGGTNAYLAITREDVAFSKSYMCKMIFGGVEYTSVATIDDKNDENKVFTTKPSNYAAGDLWVVGVDYAPAGVAVGTLLRAEHTNTTYGDVDWVTATKYDKELDDLKGNIETYNQYFSFDPTEGLKISAKDNNGTPSQFSTSLTNERLSFNYGNEAIAYINGTKMNIKEAEIESPLTVTGKYSGSTMLQAPVINIGNFSIIVESNGSLSIVANT